MKTLIVTAYVLGVLLFAGFTQGESSSVSATVESASQTEELSTTTQN